MLLNVGCILIFMILFSNKCNPLASEETIDSSKCKVFESIKETEVHCPDISITFRNDWRPVLIFYCYNITVGSNFPNTRLRAIISEAKVDLIFVNCTKAMEYFYRIRNTQPSFPDVNKEILIGNEHGKNFVLDINYREFFNFTISKLTIEDVYITGLPESLFPETLRELSIRRTNLTTLPEDVFNNTSDLEELELNDNELEYLPELLFQYLGNLKYLRLDGNKLTYLHDNIFSGLESVWYLDLRNNTFHIFYQNISHSYLNLERVIAPLVNIRQLYMDSCNLSYLQENTFKNVYTLEILDLSNNPLFTSSGNTNNLIFNRLWNLKELYLANCGINEISSDHFNHLPRLLKLVLRNNNIHQILEDFQTLRNLIHIDLSSNNLNSIHHNAFKNVFQRVVPKDEIIAFMDTMVAVVLRNNLIGEIHSETFQNLTALQLLDLSHNQLTKLHKDMFKGTTNILKLYLNNNKLEIISRTLDPLQNLQILDLSQNEIITLELPPDHVTSLIELDLSYNKLANLSLPESNKVYSLQKLSARSNNLLHLNTSWDNDFRNVIYLDLANNNINNDYHSAPLFLFPSLEYLDLSNNSFFTIEDYWQTNYTSLTYLNLSHNKIMGIISRDLRYAAFNLTIDIQHNGLKSMELNPRELNVGSEESNSTVILNLNHNPFVCTCDIFQFLKFQNRDIYLSSKDHNVAKITADNLKCAEPNVLEEAPVENVENWALQSLALLGLCQL